MNSIQSETVNIHASCVQLGSAGRHFSAPRNYGVLLLGESGGGKSALVLRLLHQGARLIADDRVELYARHGSLFARAPHALAGLLEIYGLGLVRLPFRTSTSVDLAIRLVEPEIIKRLPHRQFFRPRDALSLPVRRWPPFVQIHNDSAAPARIAAAAAAFSRRMFRHRANP